MTMEQYHQMLGAWKAVVWEKKKTALKRTVFATRRKTNIFIRITPFSVVFKMFHKFVSELNSSMQAGSKKENLFISMNQQWLY